MGRLFGDAAGTYGDIEFDSEPEEKFYDSLGNAGTGWSITREPEPLIAGRYLYIPDFLLEKDGMKVYVEIAGFWTAEYLKRKVAKLSELKDTDLIVLASTRSSCDAFKSITENVILFDRKFPLKEVLDRLKAREEEKVADGVKKLKVSGLALEGDVVGLSYAAVRAGVSMDAARRYVEVNGMPGYVLAGDELISDALMDIVQKALPEKMPYSDASALIRSKGIAAADPVLKHLGYTVKWSGLDPDDAVVYRSAQKTGSKIKRSGFSDAVQELDDLFGPLPAGLHVFYGDLTAGHLLLAQDKHVPGADAVGVLHLVAEVAPQQVGLDDELPLTERLRQEQRRFHVLRRSRKDKIIRGKPLFGPRARTPHENFQHRVAPCRSPRPASAPRRTAR